MNKEIEEKVKDLIWENIDNLKKYATYYSNFKKKRDFSNINIKNINNIKNEKHQDHTYAKLSYNCK